MNTTLNGSLGFERSNTLGRSSNLHHNQLNYSSFIPANAHKPLNYTYHSASTHHHPYPYTTAVLGSHRSTSGQSLLTCGTNPLSYQSSASAYTTGNPGFNAHGTSLIHHLSSNNPNLPPTNVINAANANLPTSVHSNHPLQFTTSAGSAEPVLQSSAHFASLPRTAQSLPNTPNVARRSLSPQPSFFAMPMMTTNPSIQQTTANRSGASSNLCRTNSGGNPSRFHRLDHSNYNDRNPFIAPLDLAGKLIFDQNILLF